MSAEVMSIVVRAAWRSEARFVGRVFRSSRSAGRRPMFETLEPRHCLSSFFELQVAATTGGDFTSLGQGPSINDQGFLAFVAESQNGDGLAADNVYARSPQTGAVQPLMNGVFMYPNAGAESSVGGSQSLSGNVQINELNEVLTRRRLNAVVQVVPPFGVITTAPLTYLETWDATLPNPPGVPISQVAMGDGGAAGSGPLLLFLNPATGRVYPSGFVNNSDFAGLYSNASLNNLGLAAFGALMSNANGGDSQLVVGKRSSAPVYLGIGTPGYQAVPMLADNGTVVVRNGDATQGIFSLANDYSLIQQVAGSSNGFSALSHPGISDDGRVIVFSGNLSSAGAAQISASQPTFPPLEGGPGVFAALVDAGGFLYVRIAGVSGNGVLDPGESYVDLNGNLRFDASSETDQGRFASFLTDSRVGVNRSYSAVDSDYSIVFRALNTSGGEGLYGAEIHLLTGTSGAAEVGVEPALPVVETGDSIPGVGNGIDAISIYDPVNNNGQITFWVRTSAGTQAILTASHADTDGDGLYDHWESQGIDLNGDGMIDLDLPALGADPRHKDLFVEVDAMSGRAPAQATLDRVVAAFADAPANLVNNPDGLKGIHLHATLDDTNLPLRAYPNTWSDFFADKANFFGPTSDRAAPERLAARRLVYRYAIFADTFAGSGSSGIADGIPGNDFMVTLGSWSTPGGTEDEQAGTFMHELGHTLGLRHGGGDNIHYKPNYTSVMNYLWQTPKASYKESWRLDYSRSALPTLDESHLSEPAGIGGRNQVIVQNPPGTFRSMPVTVSVGPPPRRVVKESGPVDWNADGDESDPDVAADLNYLFPGSSANQGGPSPGQLLLGHEDWSALVFNFRGTPAFANGAFESFDEPELDFQTHEFLDGIPPGFDPFPGASDDRAETTIDTSVDIRVLDNDFDPNGTLDRASVTIASLPGHGVAVVDPTTGTVRYAPSSSFSGEDLFTYRVADDAGGFSNAATVTVLVTFSAWQNATSHNDVTKDQYIATDDALCIINELNGPQFIDGVGRLPATRPAGACYYDVNGDGFAASNDALEVINFLNQFGPGEAEAPDAVGDVPSELETPTTAAPVGASKSSDDFGNITTFDAPTPRIPLLLAPQDARPSAFLADASFPPMTRRRRAAEYALSLELIDHAFGQQGDVGWGEGSDG